MTADELVQRLSLSPHPEGGFYRETYRAQALVDTPRGPRAASTAIHFLVTPGSFSALHRIASDEVWHFYLGDPLHIVQLDERGRRDILLGPEEPQAVVPAGAWFGSRLAGAAGGFALVGCTVAPGFDFADFELGSREALLAAFPAHADIIHALTR